MNPIKNRARHLKKHPKLVVDLSNLTVIGVNAKAWYTFKNR